MDTPAYCVRHLQSSHPTRIVRRPFALCCALLLGACGGSGDPISGGGPAPGAVTSVRVSLSDSLVFVGATLQATSTALDAKGTVIAGQPVRWVISDTVVASVSGSGVVTAKAPGAFAVRAEITNASGAVAVSGSSAARARYEVGTWYLSDSAVYAHAGSGVSTHPVILPGGRAAALFANGPSYGVGVGTASNTCNRVPLLYVALSDAGKLTNRTADLVTTQPAQVHATAIGADVNADGITDLISAANSCDIGQLTYEQTDANRLLLGTAAGGFREVEFPPLRGQYGILPGALRSGGAVDLLMISARCYAGTGVLTASPYRFGVNWREACLAPGPFILRGNGDGTFTYDNTSLYDSLATSVWGHGPDSTGRRNRSCVRRS